MQIKICIKQKYQERTESFMLKTITLLFLLLSSLYAQEQTKRFNVAYMADSMTNYSKKDLKIAMNVWLQELAKKAGYTSQMFFYDDPKKIVADLKAGKIDYISAFPLVYVKYFDLNLLSDGFSGGLQNREDNLFVVLVRNDSKIRSWDDIRKIDPRVGIQKHDEIMHLYSKYKTKNIDLPIEDYSKRSRAILDLFFNKLDVVIVPHISFILATELNPQLAKKIKILEVTKINATNLGFLRRSLDEKIKHDVYLQAERIYATPKGRQMMMIYKADKLIRTKLSDLKPVEEFYKKYQNFERAGKSVEDN
jgi:ABC-type phosphate/phosphonate transport system substrate-binding protein